MGQWMHTSGYGMAAVMVLLWGLLLAAVTLLVWFLARRLTGKSEEVRHSEAREILDQRFARGEILPEEYRRIRKELETEPAGSSQ